MVSLTLANEVPRRFMDWHIEWRLNAFVNLVIAGADNSFLSMPLPWAMVTYFQLKHKEQCSVKLKWKYGFVS